MPNYPRAYGYLRPTLANCIEAMRESANDIDRGDGKAAARYLRAVADSAQRDYDRAAEITEEPTFRVPSALEGLMTDLESDHLLNEVSHL